MQRINLLKSYLIIFAFFSCVLSTFAQAKNVATCSVAEPPKLRGFFLGQTPKEINKLIPDFQQAFAQKEPDEESLVVMNSVSSGIRQIKNTEFQDVQFFWHFFEGKLYFLSVDYEEFEPPNLQYFLKQTSEKTNLPFDSWKFQDKYHASMTCNGFRVEVWTGEIIGRREYKGYPSITLIDTVAEAEIKRLRDEIKRRKKAEELERIRREREKKLVLKP